MADGERTGRVLVSFEPGLAAKAMTTLQDVSGLKASDVADAREFSSNPSSAWYRETLALDDFGLAAIDPALMDVSRLTALLPSPLFTARPEYFIRRPKTVRKTVPLHHLEGPLDSAVLPLDATALPFNKVDVAPARSWALDAIGLSSTSDEGRGVVVAVLDSGVQADHPDLLPALQFFRPESFVPNKSASVDDIGHGTHCAGLIAGAAKPERGKRYGIAPHARLMVIRVFDSLEKGPEVDVLNAVRWAVAKGAKIVSLSAGRDLRGRILPEDVVLGQELTKKGVLLITAAGNESDRLGGANKIVPANSPGNAPGILAVGAMTRARRLWNESNGTSGPAGTMVDFIAPGVEVESADPDRTLTAATGTSVATPIVAGIAAVLMSRQTNPSGEAVLAKLRQIAHALPNEPAAGVGAGLVRVD